jgi:hypothetical protein
MERRVPFHNGLVLRLLFVFDMLVWVFNVQHVNKTELRLSYSTGEIVSRPDGSDNETHPIVCGWTDDDVLKGWKKALDWWTGKCASCAGRGLRGSQIRHTIRKCRKGGMVQLQAHLGEAVHLEGLKACEGCLDCGVP